MPLPRLFDPLLRAAAIASVYPTVKLLSERGSVALSLLIFTCNRASYLNLTLATLERIWFPSRSWELIVVDNASEDGTPAVLDEYEQRNQLLLRRCRLDKREEPTALLNMVVDMACGHILAFIPDHSLVMPHFLIQHLAVHMQAREPGCAVLGDAHGRINTHLFTSEESLQSGIISPLLVNPADLHDPHCLADLIYGSMPCYEPLFSYFAQKGEAPPHTWACFSLANASLSRDILHRIGRFDERFQTLLAACLDFAFRIRCADASIPINYAPGAITLEQRLPFSSVSRQTLHKDLHYFLAKHPNMSHIERNLVHRILLPDA